MKLQPATMTLATGHSGTAATTAAVTLHQKYKII
jgi:hypothetical protein